MRIACLLDTLFEDSEYRKPAEAFREAGHEVVVIGQEGGQELTGYRGKEKATTDLAVEDAHPGDFDALFVPGGSSPDHLRVNPKMVGFASEMVEAGKPSFVICHGPQLLAASDALKGRKVTAWPTVQADLRKMGEAEVVDAEVVVDGNLVTSRKPDDIPAFNRESLRLLENAAGGAA